MGDRFLHRHIGRWVATALMGGTVVGPAGCAGDPPALPPETGFSTTSGTSETASTTLTAGTTVSTTGTGASAESLGPGCMDDQACSGATPACDLPSGQCVECLPGGEYCTRGEFCDAAVLGCMPGCDDDGDCPEVCDLETNTCVGCVDADDCLDPTPWCSTDTQTCVECIADRDCPTGICEAGECVSMGYPCTDDLVCDTDAGEQCCTADQCLEHCMVPCSEPSDCPVMDPPMECAHGYCLFACSEDADCAMWPGFTCKGMGTRCEL